MFWKKRVGNVLKEKGGKCFGRKGWEGFGRKWWEMFWKKRVGNVKRVGNRDVLINCSGFVFTPGIGIGKEVDCQN